MMIALDATLLDLLHTVLDPHHITTHAANSYLGHQIQTSRCVGTNYQCNTAPILRLHLDVIQDDGQVDWTESWDAHSCRTCLPGALELVDERYTIVDAIVVVPDAPQAIPGSS